MREICNYCQKDTNIESYFVITITRINDFIQFNYNKGKENSKNLKHINRKVGFNKVYSNENSYG